MDPKIKDCIQALVTKQLDLELELTKALSEIRRVTHHSEELSWACAASILAVSSPLKQTRGTILSVGATLVKKGLLDEADFNAMRMEAAAVSRADQEKMLAEQRQAMHDVAASLEAKGDVASAQLIRSLAAHPDLQIDVVKLPRTPAETTTASKGELH